VLVGALLTAISPLMAQSGGVRILVTDTMGAAIPDAVASLSDKNGNIQLNGRSNEAGEIVLTGVPVGTYQIRVTRPGFKTHEFVGIPIVNADELRLDVKLEVAIIMGVVSYKKLKRWWIFR
jgi:hypothetical protein